MFRMAKVEIKRYFLDHVFGENKVLFNVNNLYDERPEDYSEVVNSGNTRFWIDQFHKGNYQTLKLDGFDVNWMAKAAKIGVFKRKFSHLYDDELEYTLNKYHDAFEKIKENDPEGAERGWFIRVESVSLKYGMHGAGPYKNLKEIIESLVTSSSGHECVKPDSTEITLYFMKWLDMHPNKEFRIFVKDNKITAISDQHLYTINDWLNTKTDEEIEKMVHKILEYFEENIKSKMEFMGSYVMDLALIGEEETPYFIEPNSFGKNYASGSALFHWVYDHDALHDNDVIQFRYCNEY